MLSERKIFSECSHSTSSPLSKIEVRGSKLVAIFPTRRVHFNSPPQVLLEACVSLSSTWEAGIWTKKAACTPVTVRKICNISLSWTFFASIGLLATSPTPISPFSLDHSRNFRSFHAQLAHSQQFVRRRRQPAALRSFQYPMHHNKDSRKS